RWVAANHRWSSGALVASAKNGAPTEPVDNHSSEAIGLPAADMVVDTAKGSASIGNAMTARCTDACCHDFRSLTTEWLYAYPASSADWKNSMHVVQTAGDPPNRGSSSLANIGC